MSKNIDRDDVEELVIAIDESLKQIKGEKTGFILTVHNGGSSEVELLSNMTNESVARAFEGLGDAVSSRIAMH